MGKKFLLLIVILFICGCNNKIGFDVIDAEKMELVPFENDMFYMEIPKGWVVSTSGEKDNYMIRVYDPLNPSYQIFSIMDSGVILREIDAKAYYDYLYSITGNNEDKKLSEAMIIKDPSTEEFYNNFSLYVDYAKKKYAKFSYPEIEELNVTDTNNYALRASFKSGEKLGEGLFYVNYPDVEPNIFIGIDIAKYNFTNIIGLTTEKDELINYKEILMKSLNSLKYKFNGNNIEMVSKDLETLWSNRQLSYDILNQKTYDEINHYERVYNIDNKKIYKAYKGFLDELDDDKYKKATNDMYLKSIDGYIEK